MTAHIARHGTGVCSMPLEESLTKKDSGHCIKGKLYVLHELYIILTNIVQKYCFALSFQLVKLHNLFPSHYIFTI